MAAPSVQRCRYHLRLAHLSYDELLAFAAAVCEADPEDMVNHCTHADTLIAKHAPLPEWAVSNVLVDEDLGMQILAPLSHEDRPAACVCKAWARMWRVLECKETRAAKLTPESIRKFHPQMPKLMEEIELHWSNFRRAPLGPLGANIAIKPNFRHLSAAIELSIHPQSVISFIVFSSQDEALMRLLMIKCDPASDSPARLRKPLNDLARIFIRREEPRYVLTRPPPSRSDGATRLIDTVAVVSKTAAEADAWFNLLCDFMAEDKLVFNDVERADAFVIASRARNVATMVCEAFGKPGRRIFKRNQTYGNEHVPACRKLMTHELMRGAAPPSS